MGRVVARVAWRRQGVVKKSQKLYPPSSKASSLANHLRQKHYGGLESASEARLWRAGRFFTDFFTGRGRGGWIWLDLVGLGRTDSDWSNGVVEDWSAETKD